MGAPNFRTLSDLAFHVNFAKTLSQSSSQEDQEMEEGKQGEPAGSDSLKQLSESLTQSFRAVMLRFVQTIKSTGR